MAPCFIPLKIQDVHRKHRFGIVAKSLSNLVTKACEKLEIPVKSCGTLRVCLEEDGTEISDDDFLLSLPAHTVLIILQPGEQWMGNLNYVMNAFELLKKVHPLHQVKERIEQTMNIEQDHEKMAMISMLLSTLQHKREFDSRDDDGDWFKDLKGDKTSKNKVMEDGSRSRVRSYFYDARRTVKSTVTPEEYDQRFAPIFDAFSKALKDKDYYGGYFGRLASEEIRLCDEHGWFNCQGPFDEDTCSSRHLINPYDNKESRVVFSTWNLDHQIEKSRQVIPKMIEAVKSLPKNCALNWEYFYELLFTLVNLRLVHIACHKKCEHTTKKVDALRVHIAAETENSPLEVVDKGLKFDKMDNSKAIPRNKKSFSTPNGKGNVKCVDGVRRSSPRISHL